MAETLALASDHAGFQLKESLKRALTERRYTVRDLGPDSDERVDYPDFARAVATMVATGTATRGVLVCGSGLGMVIAANRVKGARAVVLEHEFHARMSRAHNDANIACFGARVLALDRCLELLDLWLEAPFEEGRHSHRVRMLDETAGAEE